MECKNAMALAVFDPSVAFNTMDHGILLDVLNYRFGVDGSALVWYISYFQGRSMTVHCNDSKGKPK